MGAVGPTASPTPSVTTFPTPFPTPFPPLFPTLFPAPFLTLRAVAAARAPLALPSAVAEAVDGRHAERRIEHLGEVLKSSQRARASAGFKAAPARERDNDRVDARADESKDVPPLSGPGASA